MSYRQSSISSFFQPPKKRKVEGDSSNQLNHVDENHHSNDDLIDLNACNRKTPNSLQIDGLDVFPSRSSNTKFNEVGAVVAEFSIDIGHFIGQKISDEIKRDLLENPWRPSKDYKFPFSSRIVSGKERKHYVSHKHLIDYGDWLVFSDVQKGLFCKYCAWFSVNNLGGYKKNIPLRFLVTEALVHFKDLTGKNGYLELHQQNHYHKDAVVVGKNFLHNFHNPQNSVNSILNEEYLTQRQENRLFLQSVARAVIFLGRRNIAFRGHRDDGHLLTEARFERKEGNFRALLKLLIESGDTVLEKHLETSSSVATYISKTIQEKLIDCCRVDIQKKIIQLVNDAEFYSIGFDETSDQSGKAQISLILRYVDFSSGKPRIREDFVDFIDAFGELSNDADENNENTENNVELSLTRVALGKIVEEAINAIMILCFSHKLNSSLMKTSNVQSIRKVSDIIREVTKFFQNAHPKRNIVLAKCLGHKLKHLCETRWIERHDVVLQFVIDLPMIIEALTKVSNSTSNRDTAGKAAVLISAVSSFDFIVGLFCLCDVLSLTRPLSENLQKEDMDLPKASQKIELLLAVLANQRLKAEEKFEQIYTDAMHLADDLNIEIKKPRTCGRQTRRENHITSDCKEYFRVSMYIPLLENIMEDMKIRFSRDVLACFQLSLLLPRNVKDMAPNDVTDLINNLIGRFGNLLKDAKKLQYLRLKGEMNHWQQHWKHKTTQASQINLALPNNALETLESCDKDVYPVIHTLLRIFCTMVVTNASAERSFSTLRRIKTWLRTTRLQKRLVGLTLLNVHDDIEVRSEDIVERFANLGKHRIVL